MKLSEHIRNQSYTKLLSLNELVDLKDWTSPWLITEEYTTLISPDENYILTIWNKGADAILTTNSNDFGIPAIARYWEYPIDRFVHKPLRNVLEAYAEFIKAQED